MNNHLKSYVQSQKFKKYTEQTATSFGVVDLLGEILLNNNPYKSNSLAYVSLDKEKKDIYLNIEQIQGIVNSLGHLRKQNDQRKLVAIKIVDYLIIHELVHILQFKRGEEGKLKELAKLDPKDQMKSELEKEADKEACIIMGKQDNLARATAEYLINLRNNKFEGFDSTQLYCMRAETFNAEAFSIE